MRVAPDLEATFVPADPPRDGRLALWRLDGGHVEGADSDLDVVVAAGSPVGGRARPPADDPDDLVDGGAPQSS